MEGPPAQAETAPGVEQDICRVLEIQRRRATAYQALHDAFNAFIATKAESAWRHAMDVAMTSFQELSTGVRSVIAGAGTGALAGLLRSLQDLERDKLRLTMNLYSLKTPLLLEAFSWQRDEGQADPLSGHEPGCGCGAGGGHGGDGAAAHEPSRAEHEAAMQELTRALQHNIVSINDVVDELRELAAGEGD